MGQGIQWEHTKRPPFANAKRGKKGLKNRFHIEMGIKTIIPLIVFYSIKYEKIFTKNSFTQCIVRKTYNLLSENKPIF